MNCKRGDLALIVGGFPQNIGAVVRVIELDGAPIDCRVWWEVEALSRLAFAWYDDPCKVAGYVQPGERTHAADSDLRPIRNQDGEDETLTWKSVPTSPVKEPA